LYYYKLSAQKGSLKGFCGLIRCLGKNCCWNENRQEESGQWKDIVDSDHIGYIIFQYTEALETDILRKINLSEALKYYYLAVSKGSMLVE
jgi:TPR repeat protein